MDSWSRLNERRRAIRARWRRIWDLPRIPRAMAYAAARVPPGAVVADVGASDGRFGRKLPAGTDYKTVDVDAAVRADHRSLDELAPGSVDVVACFEMIEHVSLDEARTLVQSVVRVLRPGGAFYVSTPNVHHPWAYLRSATHVTPFCYDELGGLLELGGLAVHELFRCHKDAPLKAAARVLVHPIYRIAGVDYAKSILAVARSPDATRSEN